jgi:hypothetical protein
MNHSILSGRSTQPMRAYTFQRTEAESKDNMVYGTLRRTELTITSPCVFSRVYSNTFTMVNPMPESTLTLWQRRLYTPDRHFGFGFSTVRTPHSVSPHFTNSGSSHRRNGANSHITDMVWTYRSSIPMDRKGAVHLVHMISTCLCGAYRKEGGVSTRWKLTTKGGVTVSDPYCSDAVLFRQIVRMKII